MQNGSSHRFALELLLVRHGATDENVRRVLQGQTPTSLNELGRRQARLVADRLSRFEPKIGLVVSSDLPRARETAEPIAALSGANWLVDRVWRERAFGMFEGQSLDAWDAWRETSKTNDPPGGETVEIFRERVRGALTAIAGHRAAERAVVVVTHGGVCRALLRMFARGELACEGMIPVEPPPQVLNAAIVHLRLRMEQGGGLVWRVERVNDVEHLGEGRGGEGPSKPGPLKASLRDPVAPEVPVKPALSK
jgi:broad specificity phosphatase PhoE